MLRNIRLPKVAGDQDGDGIVDLVWQGTPGMASRLQASVVPSAGLTPAPGVVAIPAATVIGQGPDVISLSVSEDAWQGSARFVLLVDGQKIGGVQTATVRRDAGGSQEFQFRGAFGNASHQVGIRFLNNAGGSSADAGRNLFVSSIRLNGVDLGRPLTLHGNETSTFQVGQIAAATVNATAGAGSQSIRVRASGSAYDGNARFVVQVDGIQVGSETEVTANHARGEIQEFLFRGEFGPGAHRVTVAFVNDVWSGSAAPAKSLVLHEVALDGVVTVGSATILYRNSGLDAGSFTNPIALPPPVVATPTPPHAAGATGVVGLVTVGDPVYAAGSRVLAVGAGKLFRTIAGAIDASRDGDVILVDAGTYTNDFAVIRTKLTILAVGGRVYMVATVPPPNYKGILTVQADLRIEGFSFSGARIPNEFGHNGAGIRHEGGKLTLFNAEFRNNQNGVLSNNQSGLSIVIDHSLFDGNGGPNSGGGNIHNIYIGYTDSAVVTNSVFQNALVGHEYKSRAVVNTLVNNLFISGVGTGTGSYNVDIPVGGQTVLSRNTFVKGPGAENPYMVHFGGEGIPYAGSSLKMQDNLFVSTNPQAGGLLNHTSVTATLTGNVLDGLPADAFIRGPAKATNNFDVAGTKLADATLIGVLPGSTWIIEDDLEHTVTLDGGRIKAIQGGSGRLTVEVVAGHVIIIGGTGGIDLTESVSSGGNQYTTAAGSTNTLRMFGVGQNTIDSRGTDLLIAGNGNQSAQIGGTATIIGGSGNNSWSVNGAATVETGSGSTTMTLGAEGRLAVSGTNEYYSLSTNGGNAQFNTMNAGRHVAGSITGGAVQMQVYGGTMSIKTAGGTVGAVLRLDHGNANVTSAGPDEIHAGPGDNTVIVSGKARVYAGTGALAVYGRSNFVGADVYGAGGTMLISGDTGNITYHGGDRDSTVRADLSRIKLLGGAGRLTINGGMANVIVGGLGGITLDERGGGGNTITTLAGSTNELRLSGAGRVYSHGRDTIVTAEGNQAIDIHGESSLVLGAGNSRVNLYGKSSVQAGKGDNRFNVGPGADVSFRLSGEARVHAEGAAVQVAFTDSSVVGAATATVAATGGFSDIFVIPGSGFSVTTNGDNGPADLVAGGGKIELHSNGADTVHLGSGAARVVLNRSGAEVWAGSGTLSLYGRGRAGDTFTLHGGDGVITMGQEQSGMRFIGGSGAATLQGGQMDLVGGSGALTVSRAKILSFQGGSGSADLSLDASGSRITFGRGMTTVHEAGYGGANEFEFIAGQGGQDVIEGFRRGIDRTVLGAGVSVASQDLVGGSAHFRLTNGSDVTFRGVTDTQGLFA